MEDQVRIDKWLWAIRFFKTRSSATEACRKGRVIIGNIPVKPSRMIKAGDVIQIRKPPVTYTYKVLQTAEKRMSAKMVSEHVVDITPEEELKILEIQKNMGWFKRDPGTGRPTKKERRDLDHFFENDL
ncbi:MAG: RNA-binding S4 domain-containing protein [Mangrovibacterium sp.]|nr:RNA-binding S4 domain-containing protein [Mangrovibacterium sp.]